MDFDANMRRLHEAEGRFVSDMLKAKRAGDAAAVRRAQQGMVAVHQESRAALKAEGRKFEAETKLDPGASDDAKVAQLLRAFERGERLAAIWFDYKNMVRISACCTKKVFQKVVFVLDAMDRTNDLACFLDHPNLVVRARAAGCLLESMPDRCLPILREICRTQGFLLAGRIAGDWLSSEEVVRLRFGR
jgi:hypothetical protein